MENTKQCNKCNEAKELNEFNNKKTMKDGKTSTCRKCSNEYKAQRTAMNPKAPLTKKEKDARNAYKRKWNKKNKGKYNLDHYVIYALPNYKKKGKIYCGLTKNTTNRMCQHRFQGRDTNGWTILATAKTKEEGLIIEKSYHDAGYAGYIHENRTLESYKQNK